MSTLNNFSKKPNVENLEIMIEKLQVLSSIKVCRRVKDLIDVYYLITNFDFDYDEIFDIMQTKTDLIDSMLTDGCFILMDDKRDLIKNAFDKYKSLIVIIFSDIL